MKSSRLFNVIAQLEKKDIRNLNKFVRSPFHNQRQDVIQLFEFIIKVKDTNPLALKKENVFSFLYPTEKFNDRKMRHTMSFLFDTIRQYLTIEALNENEFSAKIMLAKSLRKRGMHREFEKLLADTQKQHQNQSLHNIAFHYHQYLLNLEQYEFDHQRKRQANNLQTLSNALSDFYIADILRQACIQRTHQSISKEKYHNDLLPQVLAFLDKKDLISKPAISIYYHSYMALVQQNGHDYFFLLKEDIIRFSQKFSTDELLDIYLLAINCCIRKHNQGQNHFLKEAFDLYRLGLDKNIFIRNGVLSKFTYNNIVVAGMGLNEIAWVKSFIEKYKSKLDSKQRENIYLYNLAIYYHRKPDYKKAMDLLLQVNFDDVLHNLDARRMLLKMYFELDEINALESLLDSFQTFLYRQKDIGYHKTNYLNLIAYTRKLIYLNPFDKKERIQLLEEIKNIDIVADKSWLIQQINSIH